MRERDGRAASRAHGNSGRSALDRAALRALAGDYVYDARRYFFDVTLVAGVGAVVFLAGCVIVAAGMPAVLAMLAAVVGLYAAFNTFIAHCYPHRIGLNEGCFTVESFGRTDTYAIDDIKRLSIREDRRHQRLYVRINGGGAIRGRYFLNCDQMAGGCTGQLHPVYEFVLLLGNHLGSRGLTAGDADVEPIAAAAEDL